MGKGSRASAYALRWRTLRGASPPAGGVGILALAFAGCVGPNPAYDGPTQGGASGDGDLPTTGGVGLTSGAATSSTGAAEAEAGMSGAMQTGPEAESDVDTHDPATDGRAEATQGDVDEGTTGDRGETASCERDPVVELRIGDNTTDDVTGASIDTFLEVSNPDTNYGMDHTIPVQGRGPTRVALLRFDLDALPPGAVICEAELRVHIGGNGSPDVHHVYAVREAWEEFEATWNEAKAGTGWAAPGCGVPRSCGPESLGTFVPVVGDDRGDPTEYVVPLDLTPFGAWLRDPASNHGFGVRQSSTDGARIRAREYDDGVRPRLVVRYAAP